MRTTLPTAVLICVLSAGSAAAGQTPAERRVALQGCPAFGNIDAAALPEDAWHPPASAIDSHTALRGGDSGLPTGRPRITSFVQALHHGRSEASVTAWRGDDALWRVTIVGERQIPYPDSPIARTRQSWTMTAAASAEVDSIIADDCFYAEPDQIHAYGLRLTDGSTINATGAAVTTLEVDAGDRRRTASQHYDYWGLTGRLMSLLVEVPRPETGPETTAQ